MTSFAVLTSKSRTLVTQSRMTAGKLNVNYEPEGMWDKAVIANFEVLYRYFP